MNSLQMIARVSLCLLGLFGLTRFVSPVSAQGFDVSTLVAGVILTFDHNPISNFQDIDQNYGDNVTLSPDLLGHEYGSISGLGDGSTPNVTLTYGPNQPRLWRTGYGDLTNILFNDLDGDSSLQIELAADTGFEVGLFGFDLASFIPTGQTIEGLEVRDGNGNILFSVGSTVVSGTTHNDFDFPLGLFASTLVIDVDLTGLGAASDEIGIDNISFAQRTSAATGVILTFDHNPILNFQDIDQNYGDNATVSPDLLGHEYGSISGLNDGSTPNVTLTYGPNQPRLWTTGYGDLTNILFNDLDGDSSLQIELAADTGFEVGLFGFDLASFIPTGQTIEGLEVQDEDGNILFSVGSTVISGTTHNDFDFPLGLFASTLVIDVDLTGLGGDSDEVGIDNISFAQRTRVATPVLGDVNLDGSVTFLDIAPFIALLSNQEFQAEADIDQDGVVNFLDIAPFIQILATS